MAYIFLPDAADGDYGFKLCASSASHNASPEKFRMRK